MMLRKRERDEEVLDFESRRQQRSKKRIRQRRRRIFLFLFSVLTVLLVFFLVNKVKNKIEEHRLLKARNESFVGAPPFDVDLIEPNEYSRPGTPLEKIKGIVQCVPSTEIAYASNSRNDDTLSIECCHVDETGEFTDATYLSLVRLTGWLCYRFNLTEEDVIRHYDVTGKICPKYYVENPKQWEKFKKDVKAQIKEVEKEVKESEK